MWAVATVVSSALAVSAWLAASHVTGETLSLAAMDGLRAHTAATVHGAHPGHEAGAGSTPLRATLNASFAPATLTPARGTAGVPLPATLVISSPSPSPRPRPARAPTWNPGGSYTRTLDDEFNGHGIRAALWETCFNCGRARGRSAPVNSLEQVCYASANVSEPGDGFLHMDLADRPSTCGRSQPYTGAELDSKWAFSQAGGSFEARVFVPSASGQAAAWPAWWITNTTTGDEIDVVEGLSGRTAAHTHWYAGGQLQSHGCTSAAPAVGWHDFGVSVDTSSGTATFYYDGAMLCRLPYGGTSPLHLTFDNSIEAASVRPRSFPDGMLVDWVRAWSRR